MGWYGQGRGTLAIVLPAPVIVTSSLPVAGNGLAYTASLSAIHGTPPYTFSIVSGQDGNGFPACSSAGVLSGTPSAIENLTLVVQAVDSMNSPSAPVSLTLTVESAPTITSSSLPRGAVGTSYSDTLAATGGTPPYTWSMSGGADGLTLSSAGVLSGTPTTQGTFTPTFTVTDSVGVVGTPVSLSLSVTSGFLYYISPTGVDTNPGTLAAPWSLSALNNATLRGQYAGFSVGLIGDQGNFQYYNTGSGPQTIYSFLQSINAQNLGGTSYCLFNINGGPSAAQPTYIASCDSTGKYSQNLAIIDCAQPGTGAVASSATLIGMAGIIGQGIGLATGLTVPSSYGNLTIDGITIRNFVYSAICLRASTQVMSNTTVTNCHLYRNPAGCVSNSNPGVLDCQISGNAQNINVTNNLIHDATTSSGGSFPYGIIGIMFISSNCNVNIANNTCYNCVGLTHKDSPTSEGGQGVSGRVHHNYFEVGSFGIPNYGATNMGAGIFQMITGPGQSLEFDHNIVVGTVIGKGEAVGLTNEGAVSFLNNTFYIRQGQAFSQFAVDPTNPGTWTVKQNLFIASGYTPTNLFINIGWNSASIGTNGTLWNNNWFSSNVANLSVGPGGATNYTINSSNTGTWQTSLGLDTNSIVSATNPFASAPTPVVPNSFALTTAAQNAMTANNGAVWGALDGSGPVGCNFAAPTQFPLAGGYLITGSVQTSFGTTAFQQQVATLNGAVIGLYPGWTSGGYTMSSAAAAVKLLNPNTQLFPYANMMELEPGVGASGSPYSPIYNAAVTGRWFTYNPYNLSNSATANIVDIDGLSQDGLNVTNFTTVVSSQNYQQWRVAWTAANEVTVNWNGVYLDNFQQGNNNVGNVDFRQTGTSVAANSATAAQDFRTGYATMATALQGALAAPNNLVLGNAADWNNGTITGYPGILNGAVMEHIINGTSGGYYESQGWSVMMAEYSKVMQSVAAPALVIFSADYTNATNYAGMRYGLCSCLLDNALFYYNAGATNGAVTAFDELAFALGPAIAGPNNPTNGTYSSGGLTVWKQGVWRRDFANGIILVNPRGNGSQTVSLTDQFGNAATYYHLTGTQDATTNNGAAVTSVTLPDAATRGTGGAGLFLSRTPT